MTASYLSSTVSVGPFFMLGGVCLMIAGLMDWVRPSILPGGHTLDMGLTDVLNVSLWAKHSVS